MKLVQYPAITSRLRVRFQSWSNFSEAEMFHIELLGPLYTPSIRLSMFECFDLLHLIVSVYFVYHVGIFVSLGLTQSFTRCC
jgi:hypothetical protein